MSLTSLLVCADAHAVQILTRILSDLGIAAEPCGGPSSAMSRLSAQHYDLLLVDCKDEAGAIELLTDLRRNARNRNCPAVAIVDTGNKVREVFARGANFVLYKPISVDRASVSLRAARSLMRHERRQKPRAAVLAQAELAYAGEENVAATMLDLSEHGVAIKCNRKLPPACKIYFQFVLPGHVSTVRLSGEMIWQDSSGRVGLRFADVPQSSRRVLSDWLRTNVTAPDPAASAAKPAPAGLGLLSVSSSDRRNRSRHACRLGADVYRMGSTVPHRCSLSDISTGGCYVETTDPFPAATAVEIIVRTEDLKLRIAGKVQVMHPAFGMGVQFSLPNSDARDQVQQLIALVARKQAIEDVTVTP